MAVVKMNKIRIISLRDDTEKIMETLTRSHCFEVKPIETEIADADFSEQNEQVIAKQARVGFAINYIQKTFDKLKEKKNAVLPDIPQSESVRMNISSEEFFSILEQEKSILEITAKIDQISFEVQELLQEKAKRQENIKAHNQYLGFKHKYSIISETKKTFSALFLCQKSKQLPIIEYPGYSEIIYGQEKNLVFVVGLKEHKEEITKQYMDGGFLPCPFSDDFSPAQIISADKDKIAQIDQRLAELQNETLEIGVDIELLKVLYDYYNVLKERYSVSGIKSTAHTTILEGWCPEKHTKQLQQELKNNSACLFFEAVEPDENELVPTLLQNSSLVEPFEDLTEMYTVPDYRETDPNKFMWFWYFMIFGIMCGDVVFGLIITLSCVLMLKLKKSERGMRRMLKMFAICGISSCIWGFLFGSFFGQSIQIKGDFFLSFAGKNDAGEAVRFLGWFNPMEKPITLLGLGLVVGILHLMFGYALKFAALVRERKPFEALCEGGFSFLLLLSLFFIGADIFYGVFSQGVLELTGKFLPADVSSILSTVGMILALVGVGGIVLTAGRESLKKKKIGLYLAGGLNGLYGLIGIVSDILSYSRIFGLGLSGAAISYAFNVLVDTIFFGSGNAIMFAVGILMLIILNIFNLAISLLGTYVHNARLQFLEFYGKFLTGDGRSFQPLGGTTVFATFGKKGRKISSKKLNISDSQPKNALHSETQSASGNIALSNTAS